MHTIVDDTNDVVTHAIFKTADTFSLEHGSPLLKLIDDYIECSSDHTQALDQEHHLMTHSN